MRPMQMRSFDLQIDRVNQILADQRQVKYRMIESDWPWLGDWAQKLRGGRQPNTNWASYGRILPGLTWISRYDYIQSITHPVCSSRLKWIQYFISSSQSISTGSSRFKLDCICIGDLKLIFQKRSRFTQTDCCCLLYLNFLVEFG